MDMQFIGDFIVFFSLDKTKTGYWYFN